MAVVATFFFSGPDDGHMSMLPWLLAMTATTLPVAVLYLLSLRQPWQITCIYLLIPSFP